MSEKLSSPDSDLASTRLEQTVSTDFWLPMPGTKSTSSLWLVGLVNKQQLFEHCFRSFLVVVVFTAQLCGCCGDLSRNLPCFDVEFSQTSTVWWPLSLFNLSGWCFPSSPFWPLVKGCSWRHVVSPRRRLVVGFVSWDQVRIYSIETAFICLTEWENKHNVVAYKY